jgi:hypothetical protein
MTGPVPISSNTDQLRIVKGIDQRLQAYIATYAKQRASPKTYGQAITPGTVRTTPILPERISKRLQRLWDGFKGRAHGNTANDSYYTGSGGYGTLGKNLINYNRTDEDDPWDQPRFASLDDDDRFRSEYYGHCATTAPLTDDTAILPKTLDASSLADTIPKCANKDSENDLLDPTPIVNMFTIAT